MSTRVTPWVIRDAGVVVELQLFKFILAAAASTNSQWLSKEPYQGHGICQNMFLNNLRKLDRLRNCVVVLGNLHIPLMLEATNSSHFENRAYESLREVTGFLLIYRVKGLDSLGRLFPNLARIRGEEVMDNYSLVIHDMENLNEVGLYSLVKIDRGGVIIWGGPLLCFVDTVDWQSIAPGARHDVSSGRRAHCNMPCRCSLNYARNYCWNVKKCQRFLTGPESEKCHEQCLGCRNTNSSLCSVCRFYTHRGQCVPSCPVDTIIIEANKYCVTVDECLKLNGWSWNNTCIFKCPLDYKMVVKSSNATCEPCVNCGEVCPSQHLTSLDHIQSAEKCVIINGSLTIHVRAVEAAMEELRRYLSRIEEISDYLLIYGSQTITSLDFLKSLKRIGGKNLKGGKYSLLVNDMPNLQSLFTKNVTENINIQKGTMKMYRNPVLCVSEIEKITKLFPVPPNQIDIPQGLNGYIGSCKEVSVGLQVRVTNETTALVMFSHLNDSDLNYSVLYVRVPPTVESAVVPESCSESDWFVETLKVNLRHVGYVELNSLRPASTYAICIESYDPNRQVLARSPVTKFSTPVGKPPPPFITELLAFSSDSITIRWVDHRDYHIHVTHYQLDVKLIEIDPNDATTRDHCRNNVAYYTNDFSRHAVVKKPPPEYGKSCQSLCGVLSTVTDGAIIEDNFDVCTSLDRHRGCDSEEAEITENTTMKEFVNTLVLNFPALTSFVKVEGLAPFRQYRFRLRACTDIKCSQSSRGVIQTFPSKDADRATVTNHAVNAEGDLQITWKPPDIYNGLILAYFIQVFPQRKSSEMGYAMPQSWCVLSNKLSLDIKTEKTSKYLVRVCTMSLAGNTCGEWKTVSFKEYQSTWWSGIVAGTCLCIFSSVIAWYWKPRVNHTDTTMLIDDSEEYESHAMFSIPLRDTQLD